MVIAKIAMLVACLSVDGGAAAQCNKQQNDASLLQVSRLTNKQRVVKNQLEGVKEDQQFMNPDVVTELRCVHCIMTAANWNYMISEGTLLAAARDGFLLPWDADGDFAFDDHGGDYASFYKLFSPGPMSTASKQCPSACHQVEVHLFMGTDLDEQFGTKMHFWQGYADLVSGNLLELNSDNRRKAPADTHKKILERIKNRNPARLHIDGSRQFRAGGRGYLDLVSFQSLSAGTPVEIYEAPLKKINVSDVMPINKHCILRNFGKDGVETIELSCPADPSVYLKANYGDDWQKRPFNKYDGGKWLLDERAGTLEGFLRKRHNYTGPLELAHKPASPL